MRELIGKTHFPLYSCLSSLYIFGFSLNRPKVLEPARKNGINGDRSEEKEEKVGLPSSGSF